MFSPFVESGRFGKLPGILLLVWLAVTAAAFPARDIPADSVPEFEQAVRLVQNRHHLEAVEILAGLARRHPRSFEVHHLLALALDLSGELHSANRYFHRAVELNPASVAARTNLGASYVRLGRHREAIPHLELALRLEPRNSAAAFNMGMVEFRERDFEAALPWMERAWSLQPRHPENAYRLAFCHYLLGNHRRVSEVLSRVDREYAGLLEIRLLDILNRMALGNEENPGESLAPILRQLPEMVDSHDDLVLLLFSRNLHAESVPLLEQAALREPGSPRVHRNLAVAYLRSGSPEKALRAGRQALSLEESAGLHSILGESYEALDEASAALRHYQRATELDPSEPRFFLLGRTLLRYETGSAATSVFLEGLRQHPRSWRLWLGLGTARLATSDLEGAAEAFLRGASLRPREMSAYRLLALVFHRTDRWFEEAVGRFERYFQQDRQEPWAAYFHALAQVRRSQREVDDKRLQLAVVLLKDALRRTPEFSQARLLLGEVLLRQARREEAVDLLEEAARSDPGRPASRDLLESARRIPAPSSSVDGIRAPDRKVLLSEPEPETRLAEAIALLDRL